MKTAHSTGHRKARLRTVALALGTAALLAACFGGGGDDAAPYSFETADAPPEGAAASGSSVVAFIADLAGSPLEGREPFNLDAFTLPTSDDTAPPVATSIDQ